MPCYPIDSSAIGQLPHHPFMVGFPQQCTRMYDTLQSVLLLMLKNVNSGSFSHYNWFDHTINKNHNRTSPSWYYLLLSPLDLIDKNIHSDLISRCHPIPGSADPPLGLSTSAICTQTNVHIMRDGFKSFPSGHSSSKA
jgi:membrane-associated phospholipid phosphatase